MASKPTDNTNIGKALSEPRNVWRLHAALQRIAFTCPHHETSEFASGILWEPEFGPREFSDELTTEEAEAGMAALVWTPSMAEVQP